MFPIFVRNGAFKNSKLPLWASFSIKTAITRINRDKMTCFWYHKIATLIIFPLIEKNSEMKIFPILCKNKSLKIRQNFTIIRQILASTDLTV